MNNQKGITLITLVITIIILIIITGVVTYSGLESINISQKTAFISELEMIQAKVNVIYEERKASLEKIEYYNTIGQDISNLDLGGLTESLGETSKEGFRLFKPTDLDKLGLDNINQEILINYDTREVVSLNGFEIEGIRYYKLSDIPNYMGYNVDYTNSNTKAPEFTVSKTKLSDNKYKFTIKDIVYNSNVNGGTVKYKKHSETNWILNGENMDFTIKEPGLYDICFTDSAGNSTTIQEWIYVQNGLIAHYDGENNIGSGHDSASTIWKDLSGNGHDATLNNFDTSESSGWEEKALQLSGNGDEVIFPVQLQVAGTFSVEIVLTDQNHSMLAILSSNKLWKAFNAHTDESGGIYIGGNYVGCNLDRIIPSDINYTIPLNKPILLTYTYNGKNRVAKLYVNGKEMANKTYNIDPIEIENFYIPTTQKKFNRINFYNQVLEPNEIKINYEIDKYRFGITE